MVGPTGALSRGEGEMSVVAVDLSMCVGGLGLEERSLWVLFI